MQNVTDKLRNAESLSELETSLRSLHMGPGWNKEKPAMWAEPQSNFLPVHWSWRAARAGLHSAGDLVDTKLAERRNLVLMNPIPGNNYATLRTIVTAYQMIRPGERARSHRHVPNALRLMIEGDGAYTVVDSVRYAMEPGDVLLTPSWTWHGHGSDGTVDGYWLDFLDVPFIQLIEPMFFENHPDEYDEIDSSRAAAPFRFPWAETAAMLKQQPLNARTGRVVELPSEPLSTLSIHFHQFDAGMRTMPTRSTANQVFAVKHGKGTTIVADREVAWEAGDVFTVPPWSAMSTKVAEDSVLFRVSDERMQRSLNLLRTLDV